MSSFGQTTLSPCLESDGDGIGGNEQQAEQGHWTERGRAASVSNSDVAGRPRRSVPSFGHCTILDMKTALWIYFGAIGLSLSSSSFVRPSGITSPRQKISIMECASQ
jgi:dihydroxyacid dehydratase/phosphogluconate dehydratase